MTNTFLQRYRKLPRAGRIGLIAALLLVLYGLLGSFLLPHLLKPRLIEAVSTLTGREASLAELRINPYTLRVEARGFLLRDHEGARFVGFEQLEVDLQASSLLRRTWTFRRVALTAPTVEILRQQDRSFAFADLIPEAPPADAAPSGPPPSVLVFDLEVIDARIGFEDRSRSQPYQAELADLDIALQGFTTRVDETGQYQLAATTGEGERIEWQGDLTVLPLRSSGSLALSGLRGRKAWEYLQDQLGFELAGGELALRGDYRIARHEGGLSLRVENGTAELRDLRLADRSDASEVLALERMDASGIAFDLEARRLTVASVLGEGTRLRAVREADGALNLQRVFGPPGSAERAANGRGTDEPTTEEPSAEQPARDGPPVSEAPGGGASPFEARVDLIDLGDIAIDFTDLSTPEPVELQLRETRLQVSGLAPGTDTAAGLSLQARLGEDGALSAEGELVPAPLAATLRVQASQLALPPLQPYLAQFARLDLRSGALSAALAIDYAAQAASPLTVTGRADIDALRIADARLGEDLVRWDALAVEAIDFAQTPLRLDVGEVRIQAPYTRLIIDEAGQTNLAAVMIEREAPRARAAQAGPPPQISVGAVRIADGSLNFSDLALTPDFRIGIQSLNGSIAGLSSEQLARAKVELEGQVDTYAPARISGQINPLAEDLYTDIEMRFSGIDLTSFTPYAGKFAGFAIDKGKLDLDLRYTVSQDRLVGENRILLDQLTLGEKVDSPSALDLPIELALALMKDSRGVIDVDLPVRGDLSDPEFSYGGLIGRALVNLLTKIVTAPFAALGNLLGADGESLSTVAFEPGTATLAPGAAENLATLAKALQDRPNLRLDIRGVAAPEVDGPALAEARLDARLQGETPTPLTPEQRDARLLRLYAEQFDAPAEDALPPVTADAPRTPEQTRAQALTLARSALLDAIEVEAEAYARLARARATTVRDTLVDEDGLQAERIFLLGIDTEAAASDGLPVSELELEAAPGVAGETDEAGKAATE